MQAVLGGSVFKGFGSLGDALDLSGMALFKAVEIFRYDVSVNKKPVVAHKEQLNKL